MMSVSKLQKKADVDAVFLTYYNHVANKQIELSMSCVMHHTHRYPALPKQHCLNSCKCDLCWATFMS